MKNRIVGGIGGIGGIGGRRGSLQACSVLIAVICVLAIAQPAAAQQSTWTDSTGTYQVEAVLERTMEVDGNVQAVLVDGEGLEIPVPLSKLCEADQKRVVAFMEKEKAAAEARAKAKAIADKAAKDNVNAARTDRGNRNASEVTSRPLGLPIAEKKIQAEPFDSSKAIRIDKDIKRDDSGQPTENPVFLVDVSAEGIRLLPDEQRKLAMILMDDSVEVVQKRQAVSALAESWPVGRSDDLVAVVINTASSQDKSLRLGAIDILAARDPDQSLAYILCRVDDRSFEIRSRAYELLESLGDPRIIPELCERLDSPDRRKVGRVLKSFGSTASPWVLPWLKSDRNKTLLDICHLLGDLGGDGVVEALQQTADASESLLVKAQAESSIRRIKENESKAAAGKQ